MYKEELLEKINKLPKGVKINFLVRMGVEPNKVLIKKQFKEILPISLNEYEIILDF